MQKSSFFGIIELRKTITPQGDYTKMKRNIQLLISEEFAEKTIPENDRGSVWSNKRKLQIPTSRECEKKSVKLIPSMIE